MIWRGCLILFVALTACLTSVGCGTVHNIHYYSLGDASPSISAGSDTTKPLVRVERLTVAEPYAGRRLVYRPTPNEIAFWEFHQWAAPPARMITARLANRMGRSGLFRDVDCFPYSYGEADLVLRGTVLAFEELDRGSEWYAHVKIFLELSNRRAGPSVLWSKKIEVERKALERKPKAMVNALSEALDEAIAQAEEGMAAAVRSQ
jgi:ABC-type uncharacterized transport system auxiliary subunit